MKLLLLAVFLASGFASSARAAVIQTFQVGGWSGAAYSTDSGNFSHCAGGMKFRNKITVLFSINKNFVWTVAFHNPDWVFEPGQQIALNLGLDKGPTMKLSAKAFDRSGVVVILEDDAELFRRFTSAKRMKVSGARESFDFEMARIDELFTRLLACVKQHDGAPDTPVAQNPFISTRKGGDAFAAEATAFAASMLSDAKITGYRFLGPDENKALDGDARWIVPGHGLGYVRIFPDIGMDAQKTLGRQMIARNARECEGKFGSALLPDDEKGPGSAFVICESGEVALVMYFFSIPRVAGGAYVIMTGYYGADGVQVERAREEHQSYRDAVFNAKPK